MSKCSLYFVLLAGSFLSAPIQASSSPGNFNTMHTRTDELELKPFSFSNTFRTASICFLGVGSCDPDVGYSSGDDYTFDSEQRCLNEGFTNQNCTSVQSIDGVCPYNSAYGKGCKCSSNLVTCPAGQAGAGEACDDKYASCGCSPSLVSCPSNKNGTGASCGGKFEGCSCKSEYIYTSANCTSPRSLSGSSCDGKYTGCSCPKGISEGSFGCAEYYSAPCSGVCKTAKSNNCDNRSSVPIPYGCAEYWADCPTKCETAYNDNCRNRTAVSTPYGCEQAWGDCQAKCQAAAGNPDCNVKPLSCQYGCASTNSCGKCTTCKTCTLTKCSDLSFYENSEDVSGPTYRVHKYTPIDGCGGRLTCFKFVPCEEACSSQECIDYCTRYPGDECWWPGCIYIMY